MRARDLDCVHGDLNLKAVGAGAEGEVGRAGAELVDGRADEEAGGVGRVVADGEELVGVEHVVRRLDLVHHLRGTSPALMVLVDGGGGGRADARLWGLVSWLIRTMLR